MQRRFVSITKLCNFKHCLDVKLISTQYKKVTNVSTEQDLKYV